MRIITKSVLQYWLLALIFSVGFGEIFLSGIVDGNPVPFQFFVPISIYYAILSFIFALLVERLRVGAMVFVFFVYGVLAELYVFKNISGFMDIPGILFFGGLYICLFGVPIVVKNRFLA